MKDFSVKFNLADGEFFTALRLVAGALCSIEGKDVDTAEDFKVCVTESAIILKNCGFESVSAVFSADGKVKAKIYGEGGVPAEADNELSFALIGALVEKCSIEKDGSVITAVTLEL